MQINKKTFFNVTYVLLSIGAIVSSLLNVNMVADIFLKISAILFITGVYIFKKREKIKIIYILIVLLMAYSNSLLHFGDTYIKQIIYISMLEKIALLVIVKNFFKKKDSIKLLKFNLLVVISTGPLYYFFYKMIPQNNFVIFICYLLTCISIALSYVSFIKVNNKKMIYYFMSILLFCFAEVFFGIFFYFDKSPLYISGGFFILSFARYFLYNFMLENS